MFDKFLSESDPTQKNNLMHLTNGKFADNYWKTLIKDQNLDTLANIVK